VWGGRVRANAHYVYVLLRVHTYLRTNALYGVHYGAQTISACFFAVGPVLMAVAFSSAMLMLGA
jgi:hypothetical protein